MAQRIHIVLEDDLVGGPAHTTIRFALDGQRYEIDLNESNAEQLRRSLAPYTSHGREVRGRIPSSGPVRPARTPMPPDHSRRIRNWARENGHEVSDRGRLSRQIVAAYEQRPV
ncbi:histone-like nucleoid-structuring protein Lsr2 [Kitasatospora sp. NPDC001225]